MQVSARPTTQAGRQAFQMTTPGSIPTNIFDSKANSQTVK